MTTVATPVPAPTSAMAVRRRAFWLLARTEGWTPPSLADGRLYVRNRRQIVCYDLKK